MVIVSGIDHLAGDLLLLLDLAMAGQALVAAAEGRDRARALVLAGGRGATASGGRGCFSPGAALGAFGTGDGLGRHAGTADDACRASSSSAVAGRAAVTAGGASGLGGFRPSTGAAGRAMWFRLRTACAASVPTKPPRVAPAPAGRDGPPAGRGLRRARAAGARSGAGRRGRAGGCRREAPRRDGGGPRPRRGACARPPGGGARPPRACALRRPRAPAPRRPRARRGGGPRRPDAAVLLLAAAGIGERVGARVALLVGQRAQHDAGAGRCRTPGAGRGRPRALRPAQPDGGRGRSRGAAAWRRGRACCRGGRPGTTATTLHRLDHDRLRAAVGEALAHRALLDRTLQRQRLGRHVQRLVARVLRITHSAQILRVPRHAWVRRTPRRREEPV